MTKNDFNSDPLDQADPLSATGMFLNSFGATPSPASSDPDVAKSLAGTPAALGPGATRADWSPPLSADASPASISFEPASSGSASSAPGEFTQMFRAMEQRPSPPVSPPPLASPVAPPAPSRGPGEFTRIFVSGSTPSTEQKSSEPKISEQRARTVVEPPIPPPASSPSRLKGFSTPGVSDSASAEGSFTQFFKASPAAPTPTPPVQSYKPPTPAPPPHIEEKPWQREPEFDSIAKPADTRPSSPSATGLLSALSSPGTSASASRQPDVTPYRPEPLPSYTPPSAESSTMEAGSVTKLIQRLSQVPRDSPREAPPTPVTPVATSHVPPPVSSSFGEPGEFTRMISGDAVRAALATAPAGAPPPQPAPLATTAPAVAVPHLAVPAAPAIAPPAMPAPKAAAPPKIELPKIAPLAPPALTAPKSKLETMVPILLVVNTFLLVVLLVVVIFALKAK